MATNLAQNLFDDTMRDYPELQPFAEKVAKIIINVAQQTHERTRSSLATNLGDYLTDYHKAIRKKKPPAKHLQSVVEQPQYIFKRVMDGMHDGNIATIQQFMAKYDEDFGEVIGEC